MSKEDLPSEEGQGSQTNKHITGLVKCVLVDAHKKEKLNVVSSDINPIEEVLGKSLKAPTKPDSVEDAIPVDISKVAVERGEGGFLRADHQWIRQKFFP
jgi:hypothetical protein